MHSIRRTTGAAVAVGASVLLAACSSTEAPPSSSSPGAASSTSGSAGSGASASNRPSPSSSAPVSGEPRTIASGLEAPWSVVFLDGTPLVSERDSARILELDDDGAPREIGTVAGVESQGEAGLLGLALDGQGRLYVYSTAADGNRIQRFALGGKPGSLSLGEPETIIDKLPSAAFHNGGRIAFGPDGMLYATVGDAGGGETAQDRGSLAGKILRMTPDGGVPRGNPFPDSLVYSYGHRNPQGLAWTEDGTMFATEFGQDTWDELNVITAGANYGWPEVEGIADTEGYTDPVQQWKPSDASPSGMAYLDGTLFIANLRGEVLRTVQTARPDTSTEHYAAEYGRLRDVAVAPDGDVWVLTNNTDGRGTPGAGDDRILGFRP